MVNKTLELKKELLSARMNKDLAMFRPNNDLFALGMGYVTTAEQRAKIKETLACEGLNDSGFSDRSPAPQPKDMRRVNPNIPRPG